MDEESVLNLSTWSAESYTYLLHSDYGSPEVERDTPEIKA